jgi:hypothetical protein
MVVRPFTLGIVAAAGLACTEVVLASNVEQEIRSFRRDVLTYNDELKKAGPTALALYNKGLENTKVFPHIPTRDTKEYVELSSAIQKTEVPLPQNCHRENFADLNIKIVTDNHSCPNCIVETRFEEELARNNVQMTFTEGLAQIYDIGNLRGLESVSTTMLGFSTVLHYDDLKAMDKKTQNISLDESFFDAVRVYSEVNPSFMAKMAKAGIGQKVTDKFIKEISSHIGRSIASQEDLKKSLRDIPTYSKMKWMWGVMLAYKRAAFAEALNKENPELTAVNKNLAALVDRDFPQDALSEIFPYSLTYRNHTWVKRFVNEVCGNRIQIPIIFSAGSYHAYGLKAKLERTLSGLGFLQKTIPVVDNVDKYLHMPLEQRIKVGEVFIRKTFR